MFLFHIFLSVLQKFSNFLILHQNQYEYFNLIGLEMFFIYFQNKRAQCIRQNHRDLNMCYYVVRFFIQYQTKIFAEDQYLL